VQAIPAGFLVAAITWLLPNAKSSKFFVIFLMTYLIAIGDFAHVIVGSAEVFTLLLQSAITIPQGLLYLVMAALGNILGGTGLFTLMAYAQVKQEVEDDQ
jgi:formate/nitrite transporter FocA (FNT family)